MKNYLQIAVIKTNAWWPFSFFYRWIYQAGIRHWTGVCKNFPQIKSVYLRDSLATGDWTPGLSDIDLTVVIRDGLSAEEEFEFLTRFWKSYQQAKKIFPMLGEVDVFDEHSMKAWSCFGVRGYESRFWKLLYGEGTLGKPSEYPLEEEALNHALRFFKVMFWEEFFSKGRVSWNLRRLTRKILKYAVYRPGMSQTIELNPASKEELLSRLLKELDGRLSRFHSKTLSTGQTDPIESVLFFSGGVFRPADQPSHLVLIKDALGSSALTEAIRTAFKRFEGQKNPIVMTSAVFRYILQVQDPLSYDELKRVARVESGINPFLGFDPPNAQQLTKGAADRLIHALSYPRRQKLLSLDIPRCIYSFLVQEILSLKLFLEKGEYIGNRHRLLERYREVYPEYFLRMTRDAKQESRRDFLALMKHLTEDAYRAASQNGKLSLF